ncbi:PAN domain family protein [Aspergillus tubingensis]|uniref:PAN domain family protein n=1 Tax=Aspergillus tubingensis TaxID=5068 RepID=UPI00157941F0|nr:PAN domain family protein [Aspergillus tubingensis]GFN21588.1 PAN domain family protein [Aspergillus tubingensis]
MSSDPEIKEITISSNADTEILIKEYTREWIGDKEIIKCVLMKVERNKLHETQYFRAMFGHARWLESGSQKISLEEDNCTGMEVLLRSLHGTLDDMPLDSVTVAGTWHVIMSCDKYNVDQKSLSSWFKAWWEHESQKRINIDNYIRFSRELMYPCFVFGNAPAFMAVTRKLVYGCVGHITEHNPTDISRMHLPPRIIQQLNAARGRLRNILHRELHDQVATILKHGNCECKELTVFEYLRELARIKVWPLEESMRTDSIKKMLERLRLFDATKMRKLTDPQSGKVRPCFRCNTAWGAIVLRAAKTVAEYFDGLCLDCMDLSKDLRSDGDRDEDYWKHNELKKWDTGCRVKHGEPTWYFSFMGRREKRGLIGDL